MSFFPIIIMVRLYMFPFGWGFIFTIFMLASPCPENQSLGLIKLKQDVMTFVMILPHFYGQYGVIVVVVSKC